MKEKKTGRDFMARKSLNLEGMVIVHDNSCNLIVNGEVKTIENFQTDFNNIKDKKIQQKAAYIQLMKATGINYIDKEIIGFLQNCILYWTNSRSAVPIKRENILCKYNAELVKLVKNDNLKYLLCDVATICKNK